MGLTAAATAAALVVVEEVEGTGDVVMMAICDVAGLLVLTLTKLYK